MAFFPSTAVGWSATVLHRIVDLSGIQMTRPTTRLQQKGCGFYEYRHAYENLCRGSHPSKEVGGGGLNDLVNWHV